MTSNDPACPCCGRQGLSQCTIRWLLQVLEQNGLDDDVVLSSSDEGCLDQNPCDSPENETHCEIDMEDSDPATPISDQLDECPLPCWDVIDIDERSSQPLNDLVTHFSDLSLAIEAHSNSEIPKDEDDDADMRHDATNEHCETDCVVDHISGEALEETLSYDMGMDENLHDAYQYSKHCLRVFSFLFSPPPHVYN